MSYPNAGCGWFPDFPKAPYYAGDDAEYERPFTRNLNTWKELGDDLDQRKEHAEARENVSDRLGLMFRDSEPQIL